MMVVMRVELHENNNYDPRYSGRHGDVPRQTEVQDQGES